MRPPRPNDEALPHGIGNRRKPRRRWCRGKVGLEHVPLCAPWDTTKLVVGLHKAYERSRILICTRCGKELAWWVPWDGDKRPPPSWVDR